MFFTKNILGLDLGNCIFKKGEIIPNSFETIAKLVPKFNDVYIISRVNSEQRNMSLKRLEETDFFNKTGVKRENLYYCFDRRDKAIFAKALNVRWFIDDRPDVLIPMKGIKKILFNPTTKDFDKYYREIYDLDMAVVFDWRDIGKIFNII